MAKAFGLPGPIAHGQLVGIAFAHEMHREAVKSPAAAAADKLWFGTKPWRSTLVFARPMAYPLRLEASMARFGKDASTARFGTDGAVAFSLAKGDKVHLTGEVSAL